MPPSLAHWTSHPDGFLFMMVVLDFAGGTTFFFTQLKGLAAAAVYSTVVSSLIFKFINFVLPIRVTTEEEEIGLDETQHDEKYVQGTLLVKHENGHTTEMPSAAG